MALFSTCLLCGKKKLSLSIGEDGLCASCRATMEAQNQEKFDVSSFVRQQNADYTPPPAASDEPVYVFIDVETTGLSPVDDAIVQISALRFFGKKAIDGLNFYVNPCRSIPRAATKIHGITDEKVKDSPTIDEIKEPFMNLIKGAILVGYNAIFDLNFLDRAFHGALADVEFIDVMWLAKTLLTLPDYRLETVADYAEFHPEGGYHDSLTDCTATAAIFFRLELDKPEFSKIYYSRMPRDVDPLDVEDEGDMAPYMDAIRQICKDAEIDVSLRCHHTEQGFDITHELYIWFRVKLSGKLNYLLVPMMRLEAERLLAGSTLEITDASKSETPQTHCRIMIKSPSDFYQAAPVIAECIKEQMQFT